MRIYISCHAREEANDLADALTAAGHYVCSTWHRDPSPRPAADDRKAWADKAAHNLLMIGSSDVLVVIAGSDRYPGGKFFEAGYAFHAGKKLFTVGGVENGMLYVSSVGHAKDAAELIALLTPKATN